MGPKVLQKDLPSWGEGRLMVLPTQYPDLDNMYKDQQAMFWTDAQVNLTELPHNYNTTLSEGEQRLVKNMLAFFAIADSVVIQQLLSNFSGSFSLPEINQFYSIQLGIESVHARVYAKMLMAVVKNDGERDKLIARATTTDNIRKKTEWGRKHLGDNVPLANRIASLAAYEGVFFSSAFAVIYWLKSRGLLPGLCEVNLYVIKDETLHTDFACAVFRKIIDPPPYEEIKEILDDAVKVELQFIKDALNENLLGMNYELMAQYVQYMADRILTQLGYICENPVENPFSWVKTMSKYTKTNDFERESVNYRRMVGNTSEKSDIGEKYGEEEGKDPFQCLDEWSDDEFN